MTWAGGCKNIGQLIPLTLQQGTIDGEHGAEACLTGHLYETGERGMDQGLAHEMAADVLCFTIELLKRPGIFFLRDLPEARLCPWQKERLMLQILVIST